MPQQKDPQRRPSAVRQPNETDLKAQLVEFRNIYADARPAIIGLIGHAMYQGAQDYAAKLAQPLRDWDALIGELLAEGIVEDGDFEGIPAIFRPGSRDGKKPPTDPPA